MGGPGEVERVGGADDMPVPGMPVIEPYERVLFPLVLAKGKYSIGWQFLPARKGGPSFVTTRYSIISDDKVLSRYPLTEEGWAEAWRELMRLDPAMGDKVRAEVARRAGKDHLAAARKQLDADSLASLPEVVFLGGYLPGAELTPGTAYDVRFLSGRLAVLPCGSPQPVGEVGYGQVEKIDIGGPGLVKSGGGFTGGGFGVAGAVEGMAVAAILNAVTTKTSIKTVVQVQATGAELFFLHTLTEPEALRIQLSRAIGAVREARAARPDQPQHQNPPAGASVVAELARLASMLEGGLLTREEFDQLKARLITGT